MNLLSSDDVLRLAAFTGVLLGMALWELLTPRREQRLVRSTRWPSNIAVVVLDTLLVRLLFPIGAVALALLAEARGWGLFNALGLPAWVTVPAGIVLLDLAIYLQHVLFHVLPASRLLPGGIQSRRLDQVRTLATFWSGHECRSL